MSDVLRLTWDRLAPGGRLTLPALNRVLYVLDGALALDGVQVDANEARHDTRACSVIAGSAGATVLRYELVRAGTPSPAALLEHTLRLDPSADYLMRCDRVDFDPGGEAMPHRHQGGGIRCLIAGALELRVEGEPDRTIAPGQAWFESGREVVHARASSTEPTSFIRCAILPRAIRGRTSIMYADPVHAVVKPRRYTVFVDVPIERP